MSQMNIKKRLFIVTNNFSLENVHLVYTDQCALNVEEISNCTVVVACRKNSVLVQLVLLIGAVK